MELRITSGTNNVAGVDWITLMGSTPSTGARVTTITSSATPTPVASTTDSYIITALAAGATFGSPGTGTNTQLN